MISKIKNILKKDVVLTASWILAVISAYFVHPSMKYIGYIDFKSLGILWSLMVIMSSFKGYGVFRCIGEKLLSLTGKVWQLVLVLVSLCFFLSMFITNDVALITFVPFSIMMLSAIGRKDLMISVIVLQTIAANLGSMTTPIGNPQNLYLYSLSGLPFGKFMGLIAPYSAVSLVCLLICIFIMRGKEEKISFERNEKSSIESKAYVAVYAVLFVIALLVVARVINYGILVLLVLTVSAVINRKVIIEVDYNLLLTFIGFFIFTGNIGNIPAISSVLENVVFGHEMAAGVICSQVISNVPAALLLSRFSKSLESLLIGVNVGGLGTLIASMASLISWKLYAAEESSEKGKYFVQFTKMNIMFLVILVAFYILVTYFA